MAELERLVALDAVSGGERIVEVEATPEECVALATRLRIPAVTRLHCRFALRRAGAGIIEADGTLDAEVVQTCVVTLDEIPQIAAERFRLRFVPAERSDEDDDPDPDAPDRIPYDGRVLDLGEAASEQLALALDPYPRTPGAILPDKEDNVVQHPFASLTRLRGE